MADIDDVDTKKLADIDIEIEILNRVMNVKGMVGV